MRMDVYACSGYNGHDSSSNSSGYNGHDSSSRSSGNNGYDRRSSGNNGHDISSSGYLLAAARGQQRVAQREVGGHDDGMGRAVVRRRAQNVAAEHVGHLKHSDLAARVSGYNGHDKQQRQWLQWPRQQQRQWLQWPRQQQQQQWSKWPRQEQPQQQQW